MMILQDFYQKKNTGKMYFDDIFPKMGQTNFFWELLFQSKYYEILHKHYICTKK